MGFTGMMGFTGYSVTLRNTLITKTMKSSPLIFKLKVVKVGWLHVSREHVLWG